MTSLLALVAASGMVCAPADKVLENLKTEYQEVPTYGMATGAESQIPIVITISPKGTFTILVMVGPAACQLVAGDAWTKLVD